MSVVTLDDKNFSNEVLEHKGSVVVDFYADWCGPCKMMAPIFEEAAAEAKDVKFGKLNVDTARDMAMKYGVMSIPTLIVFKDGEVKTQVAGVQDKESLIKMAKEA
jgi:thioredoxin 1